ncbi:MAG: hypothetical protein ACKPKO_64480, partial [Candidatus Fonsibacter sp.]
NVALHKCQTDKIQAELSLGKDNGQNKSKQNGLGLNNNRPQKRKLEKGQVVKKKGQKQRKQAPASGVFRLTKASTKWYICQKSKQGKFVHVVTVVQNKCPHVDKVA